MDVEFDSDLGEIEEVVIIGKYRRTFPPYLFRLVSRNQPEIGYDNEPTRFALRYQFEDNDAVPSRCFY